MNSIRVISHFSYSAANIDERDVLSENIGDIEGKVLEDKGLLHPELQEE